MELLPCSGLHYVGKSDGLQQGSAKAFVFDGEANGLEHEQVQVADVEADNLVLNVEASGAEQLTEGDWKVAEFPTLEGNSNGDSCNEFEVDGQKLSFDSHDSEDDSLNAQDLLTASSLAPENPQLASDTIRSELPGGNQECESSLSETKWLEQDQSMAVWVKWRGKWQAGIRCARSDWPLSTLRAKPTHDRKQYLVIFFPRTRNYSWADVLLVRPINEFPQPIAYRAHKVGVKMVKDLTLAHRFIMQKLAVSMLNTIEQLQSEALIETARNVVVWKDFAMEASRCKGYSDLGRMLLKLENMILPCFLNSYWLEHSLQSWAEQCQNAHSAESIEMLKELVDAILWDEVHSLSAAVVQHEPGSEWKTWKQDVMKRFSMSNPSSCGGDMEQNNNDSSLNIGLQISRKRPKLEVRRAEVNAAQTGTQGSHQPMTVEIDSRFFDSPTVNEVPLVGTEPLECLNSETDKWGEIMVEGGYTEVSHTKVVETTLVNGVDAKKYLDPVNKHRQCTAFIEAKGRQCVRWANDGDVYCCVHLASRFVSSNSVKAEATTPTDAPMCEGTTVLGTKCKHRSLPGTSFCKKHRPQIGTKLTLSSPENKVNRKHEESIEKSETSSYKEIVLTGQVETPLQVDTNSVIGGETNGTEMLHCIGDHCLESPKRHSLYCEKHLPNWLKRARNGKSRIISKEVFVDLLKDCHSHEQKLYLHQACELFYMFFKSILSLRNPVPKEIQLQWAISEASKDISTGKFLMKLVCSEKERLTLLWGFNTEKDAKNSCTVEEPSVVVTNNYSDHDHDDDDGSIIKCKICSEKFPDDQVLSTHWMDNHKKEAQWLFRGYACAICFDSFTNKKVLEVHVQERHHVQFVEQCMLSQCIVCGSHFGHPDQLWLHVLSVHPSNFRMPNNIQLHGPSMGEDSSHKFETGNTENINSDNQGGIRKFICRFCGLKFDLLPDLGRHHQAAHMGPNSGGPRPPKRGIHYYAYKLKSGRLTRPKFKKGLGAVSYKIRNRSAMNMKKRIQAPIAVSSGEVELQSNLPEAASLGKLAESQCSAVAKLLYSEIKRTQPRPSNLEILAIARSACCKVSLQASLEKKYKILPERLYLKAAKLCSEHNILVEWQQEGFNCPKGCKPNTDSHQLPPLASLTHDGLTRPTSVAPPAPETSEWVMDECHYIIDFLHCRQEAAQRTIILCDDISFGLELVPIACVVDENLLGSLHSLVDGSDGQTNAYSLPWESFTYFRKPLLDQSLDLGVQTLQLGCGCAHPICSPETCDHVYLFDNDYEDARDIYGKPMKGRFPYDENGRIILEEGYLVYECNHNCSCSSTCQNRVLQNGVRVKLEVFKTEEKGWAVRAGEMILRGTFVCEYIGEIIDEEEANMRRTRYGREGCSYFYDIDAHINDMSRLIEGVVPCVIDATTYGNVSRYINHSCSPNLVNHQVLVESMDCQLVHIGFYANRDIAAGEELTYDYRYKVLPEEGYQCRCGASNCRGRLH